MRRIDPFARRLVAVVLAAVAAVPALAQDDVERAVYDQARALSERSGKGFARVALDELERYQRLYPEGRFLDDVRLRMARLERRLGNDERAAGRYLQVLICDRGSLREGQARSELERLLGDERSLRDLKPRLEEALTRFGGGDGGGDAAGPARLVAFVRALLLVDSRGSRELAVEEAADLVSRHPDEPATEEIALAIGDALGRDRQPERAVAWYERLRYLRPASAVVPRALLKAAEVLEGDIDDPVGASALYETVARDWERSPEAATAWLRLGQLERRRLKRYTIAVRDFDEVLERHPDHPDAFAALLAKADTQLEGLGDAASAQQTLLDGVARYPRHSRAPEALERAASLVEKELEDQGRAALLFERLAMEYPGYQGAPVALYHAARLREKRGDLAEARRLYLETARRFPRSEQAASASKRAAKLER